MKHTDNEFEQEMFCKCPYVTAQKVLSGKWAILILCYLKNGPLRFNELCKYLILRVKSTQSEDYVWADIIACLRRGYANQ